MKQLLIDHTSFRIAKLTLMTEGKNTNGRMLLQGKLQEHSSNPEILSIVNKEHPL